MTPLSLISVALVEVDTSMPYLLISLINASPCTGFPPSLRLSIISMMVTLRPRLDRKMANSMPTSPPPRMSTLLPGPPVLSGYL